jgi:hypothetical protein
MDNRTTGEIRSEHSLLKTQQNKRELMDILGKSSQDFCGHLKFLINTLWLKNQRDDDIIDLKRRVGIATSTNPMMIIKMAGPYFFKYRVSLSKRQADFFLDKDFKDDVREVAVELEMTDEINTAHEVIKKVKKTWTSFNDPEKNILLTKAIEMLGFYAKFLMATKQLNQNSQK